MSTNVIVLNADYSYLSETSWQNAIVLLWEEKAETLEETTKIVRNSDRTVEITVPTIIRLYRYVKEVFGNKLGYSKKNVFIRDKLTCAYCGTVMRHVDDCTVDHILPKAQGGKTSWKNCITSCKECNNSKSDRTPEQAGLKLKFKPYEPSISEIRHYQSKRHRLAERIWG